MLLFIALALAEDLSVTSNVKGASILLNGLDTGYQTPAVLSGLKPGMVQVTVVDRCNRGEAVVTVAEGGLTRASVMATEQMASLTVDVTPKDAIVDVDGGKVRVSPGAPVGLACGPHTVRATMDGYLAVEDTIDLGGGQDIHLPLSLKKQGMGSIELSVKPRNATLMFDGKPVGTDAVTLPSVYEGKHTIGAELDGYAATQKSITVDAGDELAYHFELQRGTKAQVVVNEELPAAKDQEIVVEPAEEEETEPEAAEPVRPTETVDSREAERLKKAAAAAEETERRRQEAEAERARVEEAERRAEEERLARLQAESKARNAKKTSSTRPPVEDLPEEGEDPVDAEEGGEESEDLEDPDGSASDLEGLEDLDRPDPKKHKADGDDPYKTVKIGSGIALMGGGAVTGVLAALSYGPTAEAYDNYNAKLASGSDGKAQERAQAYYDAEVAPRSGFFYGMAVATPVLIAGGIVLVVIDSDAPVFVPVPGGGGMVSWSGHF